MRTVCALGLACVASACGGGGGGPGGTNPPVLPAAFSFLATGLTAETVVEGLAKCVKIARAPDGRVFFNELDTGNTRILDANDALVATPFSHVDVLTGGYSGLLGLALSPDFDASHHVFVMACVPASGGKPNRVQVIRFTEVSGVGTNKTVVVDDLPWSTLNDGGDLAFGLDGTLFVSLGDVEVPANAQDDASLAGRILRYTATGGIPADNPSPASPEWCRGLRNTFALAVHPVTGDLFGADNGPTSDDEVNYLAPGKDFGWPDPPGAGQAGFRVHEWPDVIVPTALCWHDGAGWGAAYQDNLFVCSYGEHEVRRLVLSGVAHTDLDSEEEFAGLVPAGEENRPMDLLEEPGGSVLLTTLTKIYRIRRLP